MAERYRFKKGQSGNPSGRPKSFLSKAVKEDQFRKSFRKLVAIRDGFIKQLDIEYDEEGKPVEVFGVANIKEIINACKLIMAYSAGLPVQLPPATGPVKINILVGNQILLGEVNKNGSQLRLHPAGQGDTIDSRALPGSDTNRIIRMRTSETLSAISSAAFHRAWRGWIPVAPIVVDWKFDPREPFTIPFRNWLNPATVGDLHLSVSHTR